MWCRYERDTMPVFDLPNIQGFGQILATMVLPDDLRARDDLRERARAEIQVRESRMLLARESYTPSPQERRLLKTAQTFQQIVKPFPKKNFNHGMMAGVVLAIVLGCEGSPDHKDQASVGAAIRAIADIRVRGAGAENFRRHIWPTYRPVSHFWAAFSGFGFRAPFHGFWKEATNWAEYCNTHATIENTDELSP